MIVSEAEFRSTMRISGMSGPKKIANAIDGLSNTFWSVSVFTEIDRLASVVDRRSRGVFDPEKSSPSAGFVF